MVSTFLPIKTLIEQDMKVSASHYMKILFLLECIWRTKAKTQLFDDNFVINHNGVECEDFRKRTFIFCKNSATLINEPILNEINEIIWMNAIPEGEPTKMVWISNGIVKLKNHMHADLTAIIQTNKVFRDLHDPEENRKMTHVDFVNFVNNWK